MRLRRGKLIPRADGKRIEEWVGAASTGTESVSVARMLASPGWSESAQTPEFDEVVVVLAGQLTMIIEGRRERIAAGEMGLVRRGTRVVFRNEGAGACDYISVCAPAFRRELAHIEAARVLVDASHPHARSLLTRVEQRARAFLEQLDVRGVELSVSLVGDQAIRRLNRSWRKEDRATDVLSFPAGELPRGAPRPRPLGDVVISVETARRVARRDGRALEAEVDRYLAHGILHLLGYDHEKSPREARRMLALEESLLGRGAVPPLTQPASRMR